MQNIVSETDTPKKLIDAVNALWQSPFYEFQNLSKMPKFKQLLDTCNDFNTNINQRLCCWPLQRMLKNCGYPFLSGEYAIHPRPSPECVAKRLYLALNATHTEVTYLCPLDLAGDLPRLKFGTNDIGKFSPAELEAIISTEQLQRYRSGWIFDYKRFSQFNWLIVKERACVDRRIGPCSFANINWDMSEDFGSIKPHYEKFPKAVRDALAAVLLAPWENWSDHMHCAKFFNIPWVYTLNNDIFFDPEQPPTPDTLTWKPCFCYDEHGNEEEYEQPLQIDLHNDDDPVCKYINNTSWDEFTKAKDSVLFEKPVLHFFVAAFLRDGIDEFLAHITTIEAALGLQSDYENNNGIENKKSRNKGSGAVKERLAALLDDNKSKDDFKNLFNARSEYLHGRSIHNPISSETRLLAHKLARRVVEKLKIAAQTYNGAREEYLHGLTSPKPTIYEAGH